MYTVRCMNNTDIGTVLKLLNNELSEGRETRSGLLRDLADSDTLHLVAVAEDGKVVSYVQTSYIKNFNYGSNYKESDHRWFKVKGIGRSTHVSVEKVVTAKEHRGKGLAISLIQLSVASLRYMHYVSVRWASESDTVIEAKKHANSYQVNYDYWGDSYCSICKGKCECIAVLKSQSLSGSILEKATTLLNIELPELYKRNIKYIQNKGAIPV